MKQITCLFHNNSLLQGFMPLLGPISICLSHFFHKYPTFPLPSSPLLTLSQFSFIYNGNAEYWGRRSWVSVWNSWVSWTHSHWNTRAFVSLCSKRRSPESRFRFPGFEPDHSNLFYQWWREEAAADDIKPGVGPAIAVEEEEAFGRSEQRVEPVDDREPGLEGTARPCSEPPSYGSERKWLVMDGVHGSSGQTFGSWLASNRLPRNLRKKKKNAKHWV